jgi:HSP20 family molecular chaperone IbpA
MSDKAYEITAELPGWTNIEVNVARRGLPSRAKRKRRKKKDNCVSERPTTLRTISIYRRC